MIDSPMGLCLFHLLVQKYFDHVQHFLTLVKCFLTWSKEMFYLLILQISERSKRLTTFKNFEQDQKNLNITKFELADGLGIRKL